MAYKATYAPGANDVEAEQLKRAAAYAQALRDQSMNSGPAGEMVSGHYVPTFNGLKGLGQAMIARNMEGGISERQKALAEAITGQRNKEMGQFTDYLTGTPAKDIQPLTPNDDEGNVNPMIRQEATPQNLGKAYAYAMNAQTPELRPIGMKGAIDYAQQQAAAEQKKLENARLMSILQNTTPQQAIAAGVPAETVKQFHESKNYGRDKVEFKDVGGQLVPVDPYGGTPQGVTPLQKTGNPFSDLVVRGPDGQIGPNIPLAGVKSSIAAAGKPQISVDARNYNTQETEQSKVYGKQLGEMRGTITQAGYDAPAKLAQLDRMEALLNGTGGGNAAPTVAAIGSLANSFGIKLDPKLGAKEASEALAREMASSMRAPGTGPMTDKDFDNFLKRVPDLSKSPEGRKEITTTMRAALQRDQMAAKFARDYAKQNGGVIDDNFYDAMAGFYAKNPVVTPQMPATNAKGSAFQDQGKEQRYQEWLKKQGNK